MSDPITSLVVVAVAGGAVSGAAQELTRRACDSGARWLSDWLRHHGEKAIEKAKENSEAFLSKLALQVDKLEEARAVDRSIIDRAMEEPSFGALLQSALIGAAQTENATKHDVLASIISARLTAGAESVLAVSSGMAASAVAHCSPSQLKILGFRASLTLHIHGIKSARFGSKEELLAVIIPWFERRFRPYEDLSVRDVDLLHLESVSCVSGVRVITFDLDKILAENWSCAELTIDRKDLSGTAAGRTIDRLWDHVSHVQLTSIGALVGILTSDLLSGSSMTRFNEDWNI